MTDASPPLAAKDYWSESRRPLTSLAFTAPLLIIYELGILLLRDHADRNGAEAWLRRLIEGADLAQYFLLPVLTVAILLGWHHTTHRPWKVSPMVLLGMLAECTILGWF